MKPHDCSRSLGFNGRACSACRERIMGNADAILAGLMPPYNQPEGAQWTSRVDGRAYEFVAGAWHLIGTGVGTGDGVELKECGCATAICAHTIGQCWMPPVSEDVFASERYDRASWDIPTNFSPRMGTLAT